MKLKSLLGTGALTGALALAALGGPAVAQVGPGFVGKGDVQTAFGWNNATLQNNADDVAFALTEIETWEQTCQSITPNPPGPPTFTVTGERQRSQSVSSSVTRDARLNPKRNVTGFTLTGVGETVRGAMSVDGCPAGSTPVGGWTFVGSSGTSLLASHGSASHVVWSE
jgi:hypothetical protein